jgi:hypothetical protein
MYIGSCIDDKTNIACFAVFARRKTARSRADDGVFRQSLESAKQLLESPGCPAELGSRAFCAWIERNFVAKCCPVNRVLSKREDQT